MSAGGNAAEKDELEAHFFAYQQIFRAVLKKRALPADQDSAIQERLKQRARSLQRPDDYLEAIPDFARDLGVRQEALAQFIGANLLPALENVRRQMRERRSHAPPASSAAPANGAAASANAASPNTPSAAPSRRAAEPGFLAELLQHSGAVVQAPARLEELEMGALKLIQDGIETLGRYAAELSGGGAPSSAAAPAAATVTGKPAPVASSAAPAATAVAASQAPAPAAKASAGSAASAAPDRPILAEILERYGKELRVQGVLELRDYAEAEAADAPAAAPAASAATPSATSGAATVRAPPRPASAAAPVEEAPLLAEILQRFGKDLRVQGRLEPDSGLPENGLAGSGGTDSVGQDEAQDLDDADGFEPLALSFQDYIQILQQLKDYQSKGDQEGYKRWFTTLGDGARALIGLRNLELRARQAPVDWAREHQNLAERMQLSREQIEDVHIRIQRFGRLQKTLNDFTARIHENPPGVVDALKRIWPQVRLLFNDEQWDSESMMSRLKIPLLQFPDADLKQRIMNLLDPVFDRAEALMSSRPSL